MRIFASARASADPGARACKRAPLFGCRDNARHTRARLGTAARLRGACLSRGLCPLARRRARPAWRLARTGARSRAPASVSQVPQVDNAVRLMGGGRLIVASASDRRAAGLPAATPEFVCVCVYVCAKFSSLWCGFSPDRGSPPKISGLGTLGCADSQHAHRTVQPVINKQY